MEPVKEPVAQFSGWPYQLRCTLTFGDIYGQILIWMLVIFASLASGLALMGASKPIFALVGVGLILVLSLPFLLFAFTTTLLNHIALEPAAAPKGPVLAQPL
ncbi:MAG: hypothetical protein WD136_00755 [Cyanobium sp.]